MPTSRVLPHNSKNNRPLVPLAATLLTALALLAPNTACRQHAPMSEGLVKEASEPSDWRELEPPNDDAMFALLYEVQIRSANACRTDTGSAAQRQACQAKVAPAYKYRAKSDAGGYDCADPAKARWTLADLEKIKLGTIEDMLASTDDYHLGITLKYIKEKVGANTVWIMPLFPNNDQYNIPARCDNLGSPYAVRDYMHVAGSLSRACIKAEKTEYQVDDGEEAPCFGNVAFDKLIEQAGKLGLRVMMDIALNHFGHNYRYYDYLDYTPTREYLAAKRDLKDLWDFDSTFEKGLVHPTLVDGEDQLNANSALKSLTQDVKKRCPDLKGDHLVRAVNMYRSALDWERKQFACDQPMYLEHQLPGFYAGSGGWSNKHPAKKLGDNFTNNWSDVKFLYHHEIQGSDERGDYFSAFARNREYFFRIMNYWVSRGVQGFRLDHTTDGDSGMSPNEWRYLTRKVDYYDCIRKGFHDCSEPGKAKERHAPIYLAEEFGDQGGMARVVDAMIDGYIGDMRGNLKKETSHIQKVLDNGQRHPGRMLVMRALEDHDEHRLFENTGFNAWTGAGFWGIGLTTRSMPAMLMGQEFGEKYQLSFRRSDFLRARFVGSPTYFDKGEDLVNFYGSMIKARYDGKNHALLSGPESQVYLPLKNNEPSDPRIFAIMKWWGTDVVFAFHNLWEQGTVEQAFYIPPDAAERAGIQGGLRYKLVNILRGNQAGDCISGDDLKQTLYVKMDSAERLQWLRLELCQ